MKKKVSVIIPCYNCEKYIGEALESLVCQTYGVENLEIIIVDDKSKDDSLRIVKEYEWRYPESIIVIELSEQSGGFVGKVRNIAMGYASGDYVTFVDGDDVCEPVMIEKLMESAEACGSDIVSCGAVMFDGENVIETYTSLDKTYDMFDLMSRKEVVLYEGTRSSVWGRLYSRLFLNEFNFRFAEDYHISEDTYFHEFTMLLAKRYTTISDLLYRYRCTEGSLVRSKGISPFFEESFDMQELLTNEFRKLGIDKGIEAELELIMYNRGFVATVGQILIHNQSEQELRACLNRIVPRLMLLYPEIARNPYVMHDRSEQNQFFIQCIMGK